MLSPLLILALHNLPDTLSVLSAALLCRMTQREQSGPVIRHTLIDNGGRKNGIILREPTKQSEAFFCAHLTPIALMPQSLVFKPGRQHRTPRLIKRIQELPLIESLAFSLFGATFSLLQRSRQLFFFLDFFFYNISV